MNTTTKRLWEYHDEVSIEVINGPVLITTTIDKIRSMIDLKLFDVRGDLDGLTYMHPNIEKINEYVNKYEDDYEIPENHLSYDVQCMLEEFDRYCNEIDGDKNSKMLRIF